MGFEALLFLTGVPPAIRKLARWASKRPDWPPSCILCRDAI